MKTKYFLGAALCVCAAFSSCSDDVLEEQNNIPWQEGDGIQFGARAGFENNDKESRTIYTGEFYKVGNTKFEKISWIPGEDYISILSPEAKVSGGGVFADYQVTERHSGTNSQDGTIENSHYDYATLVPATQGKALQWGVPEEHHFYACYPTYATTTIEGNAGYGIKIYKKHQKVQVSGTIPNNQIPNRLDYVKGDENHPYTGYVARPVMRNAHMVAYGTHDKSNPDPVNLTFKSIVTALEIDLVGVNEAGTNIIGALIGTTDPNQQLVGQYQCEINKNLETGYPKCKNVTSDVTSNQILIPLLFSEQPVYGDASGGKQDFNGPKGVILKKGNHLKFTAFILPTDDDAATGLKNITLTLISMTGRQQHEIPIPQEQFKAHLKHYVNNVKIPTQFDSRNWMSRLDDDVYLSQLSIPGTSNSYSHAYTGSDVDYKKSQELSIAEQWNKGIRCFEIKSDRNLFSVGDLGHRDILAGSGESLNTIGGPVTVRQAIKEIWQQVVNNPTEFAVIIMNYQPTKSREAGTYLGDFNNFFTKEDGGFLDDSGLTYFLNTHVKEGNFSLENNTIKYDPTLTLRECRKKLLFIVRPSSFGEGLLPKGYVQQQSERKYLIVDGWGSLQDQWYQRGYNVDTTQVVGKVWGVNANSAADNFKGSMEQGMIAKKSSGPFKHLADTETNRFDYDTNGVKVWAQDWNRVCGKTEVFDISGWIVGSYVQWKESYEEKLKDAQETFTKATEEGATENMLFINCLSGYFIDINTDSYQPAKEGSSGGSYGNITTYTQRINKDFFEYMWGQWNARLTAPMGIVIMNRVGSGTETANPENYYLPNIVISNNFSFPLKKASSTGK